MIFGIFEYVYWALTFILLKLFYTNPLKLYYVMFGSCPWEACSFLKGNGGGMNLGEREAMRWGRPGRVGRGLIVAIGRHCMREK